jgi:hypothetical protein
LAGKRVSAGTVYLLSQRRLVGGAIGGWVYCNGWNGINGTVSNMWFPNV